MTNRDRVLSFVIDNPGHTQQEISKALGITPDTGQQVNQILRALRRESLVYRNEQKRPYKYYPVSASVQTSTESHYAKGEEEVIPGNITKENTLIVISCTEGKIWDTGYVASSYVEAGFAYTGGTFRKWRKARKDCPDLINFSWVILSAKYGFIEPEHPIGNYDVTFLKPETGPISDESLNRQVVNQKRNIGAKQTLNEFEYVVVLGGNHYVDAVAKAFNKTPLAFDRFLGQICPSHPKPTTRSVNKLPEGD